MTALSEFVPHVLEHVPGKARFEVERKLIAYIREFCKDTFCWQSTVPVTFDQTREATLSLPESATLFRILHAHDQDRPVFQGQEYTADMHAGKVRWLDSLPPPYPVTFVLSVFPDTESKSVPDFLYNHYREAIAAGAALMFNGLRGVDMPPFKVYQLSDVCRYAKSEARDLALNNGQRQNPQIKHHFL
ncbi:hypothetical protein [Pseudoalteromonas rubra]|uniref:hypothetical protein n=1 Tax=Pseudoalteromonas rubra TaxID=43658 RepID=UPI002DBE5D38|nr:hypothetical protein [Pseudoalteromonas rubra]MEC4091585.1 hypothetical protein [Pseudoalteromonas rubra]